MISLNENRFIDTFNIHRLELARRLGQRRPFYSLRGAADLVVIGLCR
jgi:hypothetical protein